MSLRMKGDAIINYTEKQVMYGHSIDNGWKSAFEFVFYTNEKVKLNYS